MRHLTKFIKEKLTFCLIISLLFFTCIDTLSSMTLNWTEVANTNNKIQFIDINTIKYNNKGLLSVLTKYSEVNPDDQNDINTSSYLIAIDCEKRLFSKLPSNGDINQVKNWTNPIDDKLIKQTILTSCSY